jgi:putative chitinase
MNEAQLLAFRPAAKSWYPSLSAAWSRFELNTPHRIAAFLGNVDEETEGFEHFVENLNYSAEGLATTWPSHFAVRDAAGHPIKGSPNQAAQALAKNPVKIANVVYARQNGNGDPASGDGFLYRGRGLPMLTFRDEYLRASLAIFNDNRLVKTPDMVSANPDVSALVAAWFFHVDNLGPLVDDGTLDGFMAACHKWNGGSIGLGQRVLRWNAARRALGIA